LVSKYVKIYQQLLEISWGDSLPIVIGTGSYKGDKGGFVEIPKKKYN
jgi:hypothetical protein